MNRCKGRNAGTAVFSYRKDYLSNIDERPDFMVYFKVVMNDYKYIYQCTYRP